MPLQFLIHRRVTLYMSFVVVGTTPFKVRNPANEAVLKNNNQRCLSGLPVSPRFLSLKHDKGKILQQLPCQQLLRSRSNYTFLHCLTITPSQMEKY